tara:strand:- start:14010 stop:15500 length:1491 start_codon:yes stop_codon:yes gene_type:complete
VGGLSTKLLLLTIVFVMISEVFIYVPSLAYFRNTWLIDRLERAAIALRVSEGSGNFDMLSDSTAQDILEELGIQTIAIQSEGSRRLIAMSDMPSMVTSEFDTAFLEPINAIMEAMQSLLYGNSRTTRVVGQARGLKGADGQPVEIEIVLKEDKLHSAMLAHSINILQLSLVISIITASLVFLSLRALLVRPFRRVTRNMVHFSEDPEDPSRVIAKSRRSDEIGIAQNQLAEMQTELQTMLGEKRTLADLGLAVSKINHDLRNILASAVLFSDRLQAIDDPVVQRFTPKLVRALDRAIDYCQSTLSYGRAHEAPPAIRVVQLQTLVLEVSDALGLDSEQAVRFENHVGRDVTVDADPDQLFRVLLNLCRNALEAMKTNGTEMADSVVNCLTIRAWSEDGSDCITISDTGPGVPDKLRATLFKAFQSSSGPGGTGLGLAIAAELVRAHDGSLTLDETGQGASFTVRLPVRRDMRDPIAAELGTQATLRVVKSDTGHSA